MEVQYNTKAYPELFKSSIDFGKYFFLDETQIEFNRLFTRWTNTAMPNSNWKELNVTVKKTGSGGSWCGEVTLYPENETISGIWGRRTQNANLSQWFIGDDIRLFDDCGRSETGKCTQSITVN